MTDECHESYQACMATRQARVAEVVAAREPWETEDQLAEKAGVDRATINRAVTKCAGARNVTVSSVKLTDLYADEIPYFTQRPVMAVEAALQACSREQLAYLFSEVLPIFHANLVRKDTT